ncbi:MAG TPA: Xaa-Pro peptidase family protein [Acidimicrobiales bacterium]|nr:Xaa-Pro peptidase family protein [Acidimicrobiales bacterium]
MTAPFQANDPAAPGASSRADRFARVRAAMVEGGVDALLLSLGADLPWLTGYEAMPLERLTMLVVPAGDEATLVVPRLEAPRVIPEPDLFRIRPWLDTENPADIVASMVRRPTGPGSDSERAAGRRANPLRLAISDRTWATSLLALQRQLPGAVWQLSSSITAPLRAVKDDQEIEALAAASAAADRVAAQLLKGEIPLIGRTEREVSKDIGRRLIAEGHQRVNFAIVGSGPNSASPHHEPGQRTIGPGEAVVCDFGGTMNGYCSDITRTVWTGSAEPVPQFIELYEILERAQAAGVRAATVGTACESIDAAARDIIAAGGYGPDFIHRTGHGIGLEEHEDPYIVQGNTEPLAPGHAFSVEPGIYLDGRYGARIEDIVVATASGPRSLNEVSHDLTVVDA